MNTRIDSYYRQLEGATIEAVRLDEYGLAWWPCMLVRRANGELLHVDVLQDPEGNGPGHLAINPYEEGEAA